MLKGCAFPGYGHFEKGDEEDEASSGFAIVLRRERRRVETEMTGGGRRFV